jgi:hypothetical protein
LHPFFAFLLPARKIEFQDQLATFSQFLIGQKSNPTAAEIAQLATLGVLVLVYILETSVEDK